MIYLSLLLLFLVLLPTGHAQNSLSCRNNFYSLEESLLSRPENRYQLMRTFYPPRDPRPIIVKVIYTFSGDMNYTDVWFWSESQFYLIQPLEIFQYTSLFFSNLPHRQSEVTVELDEGCFGANNEHMELLTQRIKLYATTSSTSPTATPQRISDSYTAIAASFEEINSDALQSNFLKVWLHVFLILFPVGTLLCLLLCDPIYILLGDKVWIKLEDESNHATIAALVQVSVLFTVLVFMLDLMAFVTTILGDFLVYDTHAAFYLSTVTGMIVDTLAFLWVMFVLVKSCHWDCKNFWYRWMKRQPCNRGESEKIKKLMSTITVAPVLCFANHIHYIILALIADPFHAGGIIITYLVSFGLHYFLFKQFYNCIVFRSYQRKKQANEKRSFALRISKTNLFSDANEPVRNRSTAIMLPKKLKVERVPFNTQTVVFGLMILAPLILLYEGVIIALFVSLPISKTIEDAPSRLYSIYQGTGILIVALLTYNIVLAPKGFSISKAVDHIAKQIGLPGQVQSWNLLSDEEKSANVITSLLQDGQLRQLVDDINMGNSETGKEMDRSQRESRTPSHVELTQVDVDRTPDIDSKNGSVEVVTPETRV